MAAAQNQEPQQSRRRYPRRDFDRQIGILNRGHYIVVKANEIGEGGMSVLSEFHIDQGSKLVVSFQIPKGTFISLKAEVRSVRKKEGQLVIGLAFIGIEFSHRRQIRFFVSSRAQ